MYGTLGLWYEALSGSEINEAENLEVNEAEDPYQKDKDRPKADIHVNLWRDVAYKLNFFDFGISLAEIKTVRKIFLYIPTLVKKEQICDLGKSLKEGDTLNAVFNDVYKIDDELDGCFFVSESGTDCSKGKIIHEIKIEDDVDLNEVSISGGLRGTIISFSCSLLDRMRENLKEKKDYKESYIRIRVFLDKNSKNIFTSDDNSSDVGFSISQNTTEVTEFRFNERRSYPPDVLRRSFTGKQFYIRAIYYFLIRNKGYSLKSQHQNFKKIRFLEPGIWDRYASYGNKRKKLLRLNQSMMIYQWRNTVKESESGIEDFTAYASFERTRLKVFSYIVVLLAFGGVGGAVLNIIVDFMKIRAVNRDWLDVIYAVIHRPPVENSVYDAIMDFRRNFWSFLILMFVAFIPVIYFKGRKILLEGWDKYVTKKIQGAL